MLFRQIEYFLAVVETGSFYEAAEKCHVSQSAISQQIKKLEDELGIKLLDRHNRTFSLTPAGEHFCRKSLVISSDVEQMIRETKRLAAGEHEDVLRLGFYKGYHGNEFSDAVAELSYRYPELRISVTSGSHDDLYHGLQNDQLDLTLNDQRRAFSQACNNLILSQSTTYIEIASRNPLCHLSSIEAGDLKNLPCILVINESGREEEKCYYDEYVGLHGEFLFSETIQDARLRIITGQGYMPVDIIGNAEHSDAAICRILLTRNGEPIRKNYCAFWKKDMKSAYAKEFAGILESRFETKKTIRT